jgi:hypothetical protein
MQEMTRDYPAFEFRPVRTRRGFGVMAYRRAGASVTGLYLIITKDEGEMRRELAGFKQNTVRGQLKPDIPTHAQQLEPVSALLDHLIDFLTKLEAVLDRAHITVKTVGEDAPPPRLSPER